MASTLGCSLSFHCAGVNHPCPSVNPDLRTKDAVGLEATSGLPESLARRHLGTQTDRRRIDPPEVSTPDRRSLSAVIAALSWRRKEFRSPSCQHLILLSGDDEGETSFARIVGHPTNSIKDWVTTRQRQPSTEGRTKVPEGDDVVGPTEPAEWERSSINLARLDRSKHSHLHRHRGVRRPDPRSPVRADDDPVVVDVACPLPLSSLMESISRSMEDVIVFFTFMMVHQSPLTSTSTIAIARRLRYIRRTRRMGQGRRMEHVGRLTKEGGLHHGRSTIHPPSNLRRVGVEPTNSKRTGLQPAAIDHSATFSPVRSIVFLASNPSS